MPREVHNFSEFRHQCLAPSHLSLNRRHHHQNRTLHLFMFYRFFVRVSVRVMFHFYIWQVESGFGFWVGSDGIIRKKYQCIHTLTPWYSIPGKAHTADANFMVRERCTISTCCTHMHTQSFFLAKIIHQLFNIESTWKPSRAVVDDLEWKFWSINLIHFQVTWSGLHSTLTPGVKPKGDEV